MERRGSAGLGRRLVTVVRCDMVGSTQMTERYDPELIRRVMDRYRETARQTFEGHGGTLERFVGDEVVGLFGWPDLHEDDALRALRAAAELRDRLAELAAEFDREGVRVQVRIGVDSGEVVIGVGEFGQPVLSDEVESPTGEAMVVATRLQQAANPGEILVGDPSLRLVGHAVQVEEAGPLTLKGKQAPVRAWRLLGVRPGAEPRSLGLDVPLVGRRYDHGLLKSAFDRAVEERTCHLVTVLGAAGVGKSRLVHAFLQSVKRGATVLHGRCLAYGGVAYGAIVQVLAQATGIDPADPAPGRQRLADLVAGDEQAARIVERVEQVLGLRPGPGPPEDVRWALQRLLELLARRRPLVIAIDDLQWAEPTLLDLVEQLAELVRGAPLLLVCMARFELLDQRPRWAGGKPNALTMQLAPLRRGEVKQLVAHLLGGVEAAPQVHEYVVEQTGGNPLFVRGLVAVLRDAGYLRLDEEQGRWQVVGNLTDLMIPLSIQALLQARLQHLQADERLVIERAAVIGKQFTVDAVEALLPEPAAGRPELGPVLQALVREGLIVPTGNAVLVPLGHGESYSFEHTFIRDAAYESIAKQTRADLHERYAGWLQRLGEREGRLHQVEEFVGYHLEQAYRNLVEVGRDDQRTRRLARRAGEVLAKVGHRVAARGDIPMGAVSVLARSLALLADNDEVRRAALLDRADALSDAGQPDEALAAYRQAVEAAEAAGDLCRATHGKLGLLAVKWFNGFEGMASEGEAEVEVAIQVFQRLSDDLGLARAWRLQAYVHWAMGRMDRARKASESAIELARRAGDELLEAEIVSAHCYVLFWSKVPLDQVIGYCEQALRWAKARGIRTLHATALRVSARAAAMQGRFDEARERLREAAQIPVPVRRDEQVEKVGTAAALANDLLIWVGNWISTGLVELLAGNLPAAVEVLRQGYEWLTSKRGKGQLPPVVVLLARALVLQGRYREAEQMTRECEQLAAENESQLDARVKWRAIRAVVLARRGELDEAERLAREAVRLAEGWEQIDSVAEVHLDLAEVLRRAGKAQEATVAAQRALDLYEQKGNLVGARWARELLERLR